MEVVAAARVIRSIKIEGLRNYKNPMVNSKHVVLLISLLA